MNTLNEFLRWRELRDRGEPYSPGTDFDGWPVIASPLSLVGRSRCRISLEVDPPVRGSPPPWRVFLA